RHTRWPRDWSSDVCSSDLELNSKDYNFRVPPAFLTAEGKYDIRPKLKTILAPVLLLQGRQDLAGEANICEGHSLIKNSTLAFIRSEERRVGKECRSRWSSG